MCNKCYKERQKKYQKERQADPIKLRKQREYRILRDYGVTIDEYDKNMETSNLCQVCKSKPTKKRKLVYDHCHKTGKFRGVLCDKCNTAIGKLGDNIKGLKKAIKYLENKPI